jgi:predicted nucleotidyltransferase
VTRDEVLQRLCANEAELRELGTSGLALFGSLARGDDRGDSDVDLLVSVRQDAELSLLGMIRLQRRLRELLDRDVDLVEREMVPPSLAERILPEAIRVF